MDPVTAALVAGAVAVVKPTATQALKDGYTALKNKLFAKAPVDSEVPTALTTLEGRPGSEPRQGVLLEAMHANHLHNDHELIDQASALMALLQAAGPSAQGGLVGSVTNAKNVVVVGGNVVEMKVGDG